MSRRKILIGASIAGHALLFAGVFVSTVWDLEQLDHEVKTRTALAIMTPPSAEGGAYTPPSEKPQPKKPPKVVVKTPVQPPKTIKDDFVVTTEVGPTRTGAGEGPGKTGIVGLSDGPCVETDGQSCAPVGPELDLPALPKAPPPPDPPKIDTIPTHVLKGMRLRGETAIHPPKDVYDEMANTRSYQTSAVVKVCLATNGTVSSAAVQKSTGYPAYDAAFLSATRDWLYRPYTVNGTPVPACGLVEFRYAMK